MVQTIFSVQRIEPTDLEDIFKIRLTSQDGKMELSFEIIENLFDFKENTELDIYIDKIPPKKADAANILMQGDVFKVQKKQDVVQVFGSLGGLQLRLIHPKSKELFQATDPLILAIF
ncbi:DNA-directed RNA polymerase subunit G [Candidatus Borrarchaeum sp.]|uniref:DNA-directed RNA polymerase subunit G n=1 Tax=Candidatus Borrarchaeum sp. TaxID=2846742 RepID=UPI00257F2D87|nr:DNA-directed RNA polymerase subunit G [Candidatus Borrarchaeum sp.]